jgi:hypothetical protein
MWSRRLSTFGLYALVVLANIVLVFGLTLVAR